MARIKSVRVAFIVLSLQYDIYTAVPVGPYLSYWLFLIALFILLCEIPLYPRSLCCLGKYFEHAMEISLCIYVAKGFIFLFWLPIETVAMDNTILLTKLVEEIYNDHKWNCGKICKFVHTYIMKYVISLGLGSFLLITVLHITDNSFNIDIIIDDLKKFTRFLYNKFWLNQSNDDNNEAIQREDYLIFNNNLINNNDNPGAGDARSNNPLGEIVNITPRRETRSRSRRQSSAYGYNHGHPHSA